MYSTILLLALSSQPSYTYVSVQAGSCGGNTAVAVRDDGGGCSGVSRAGFFSGISSRRQARIQRRHDRRAARRGGGTQDVAVVAPAAVMAPAVVAYPAVVASVPCDAQSQVMEKKTTTTTEETVEPVKRPAVNESGPVYAPGSTFRQVPINNPQPIYRRTRSGTSRTPGDPYAPYNPYYPYPRPSRGVRVNVRP